MSSPSVTAETFASMGVPSQWATMFLLQIGVHVSVSIAYVYCLKCMQESNEEESADTCINHTDIYAPHTDYNKEESVFV